MAAYKLTPRDRVERAAARLLARMPDRLLRRLAGPPIVVDGQTLDPQMQVVLKGLERTRPQSWAQMGLEATRAEVRRITLVNASPFPRVKEVRELTIPGPAGPLAARRYDPPGVAESPGPALVYFHGGGFVFGDLDSHDELCRILCLHSGATVIAVDYRLAPEYPFPAAVDDALAAFGWVHANAAQLGLDRGRIAVGGDSAGGNLSAVVAQQTVANGDPAPAFQLLIYPPTDREATTKTRSVELFGQGFFLIEEDMVWFGEHYAGVPGDPRSRPLLAEDVSGLPGAYVATAGFDPLRDEGEAYAAKLAAAGVPTALRRHEGMIHGFANMTSVSRVARDAVIEMAGALRMGLAPKQAPGEAEHADRGDHEKLRA